MLPTARDRGPTGAANGDQSGYYTGLCRPDWIWLPDGPTWHQDRAAAAKHLDTLTAPEGSHAAISEDIPARQRGWAGARKLTEWRYVRAGGSWQLGDQLGPVLLRPAVPPKG